MAVLETGLIVNGNPIIFSIYHPSELQINQYLKSSLVAALQNYASDAFQDEIDEMRFKNKYTLLIRHLDPKLHQFFLYAIVEKRTDIAEVKKRMANLARAIPVDPEILTSPTQTKELRAIKKMIDKELKDLTVN